MGENTRKIAPGQAFECEVEETADISQVDWCLDELSVTLKSERRGRPRGMDHPALPQAP